MKKIAFIVQHLTNGGAERTISNLTLALSNKYDITLFVFDGDNVTYPYTGEMIDLKLPPVDGKFGKVKNTIKRIKKVKEIRKTENFDCVISFMFGANIVNVMSKCGERVIVSARNYMSAYGCGIKDKIRERFIAKHSTLEIALSKMVKYDLVYNFGVPQDKVVILYNPCDAYRIKGLARENCSYIFNDNIFYVVSVGRFVKQKGQWKLIKAFAKFHKNVPNSRLILLGDGELKTQLIALSKAIGIYECVDFIGFVDNPYSYISRSSCFVLSSLFEGLGNVIIEAMACEIPVISYDCLAGPRELIAPNTDINSSVTGYSWEKCGILVEAPDEKMDFSNNYDKCDLELANAILSLYKDEKGRRKIVEHSNERIKEFLPETICEKWEKIF